MNLWKYTKRESSLLFLFKQQLCHIILLPFLYTNNFSMANVIQKIIATFVFVIENCSFAFTLEESSSG